MIHPASRSPIRADIRLASVLSLSLAAALLVSAVCGIAKGVELYASYPASLAGMVGQDIVTLVVGVPLLLTLVWFARLGSMRATLAWAGVLFYFAYSYFFYVVGGFNALFLVYVAIVSSSVYALLTLLAHVDGETVRVTFDARTPTRAVSGLFVVVALLFLVMWGGMSVSRALAGTQPDAVLHLVLSIDTVILLPLLFAAGVKLWHRSGWGLVLGGVLLMKLTLTGGTLAFTTALNALWGQPTSSLDIVLAGIFGSMFVVAGALLVAYLRGLTDGSAASASPARLATPTARA